MEKEGKFITIGGQLIVLGNVINHALAQMSDAIKGNLPHTEENQALHDLLDEVGLANESLAQVAIKRIEDEGGEIITTESTRKGIITGPVTRLKI